MLEERGKDKYTDILAFSPLLFFFFSPPFAPLFFNDTMEKKKKSRGGGEQEEGIESWRWLRTWTQT